MGNPSSARFRRMEKTKTRGKMNINMVEGRKAKAVKARTRKSLATTARRRGMRPLVAKASLDPPTRYKA